MDSAGGQVGGWWFLAVPMLVKQGRSSIEEALGYTNVNGLLILLVLGVISACGLLVCWAAPGGSSWGRVRGPKTIPGPRGYPVIGSLMEMGGLAHRRLAELAVRYKATGLMALSFGETRVVIASQPDTAREILHSSAFADRPLKQSAQQLLFGRAIGFAPHGDYWRSLRRIAANHLFAPKRIAAHEKARLAEVERMRNAIESDVVTSGSVQVRDHLQRASLNNIMASVFGRRYDFASGSEEAEHLNAMVREGFELLGAFNWADHLPALKCFDAQRIHQRCAELVPRVTAFVQKIIDEHRERRNEAAQSGESYETDFVDVLLGLGGDEKLADEDMIAVLWEMIFRGTDTTAILTEWIMAEMVLHPEIQRKVQHELDSVFGRNVTTCITSFESELSRLPYLQAVIKETLRHHPPGPLLSWARLSTQDVCVAGHTIPAGTTAMVNMWAITHDPQVWANPDVFNPERFLPSAGGQDIDVRGNDLRLAPFGAGRRVCPGRALGLATVQLWVAQLLHNFEWTAAPSTFVDLTEVLKLSSEMVNPLQSVASRRLISVV
ncbi:hypothetical protein KC19_3G031100 [Ceratodon purpureus]|uniref:Cytochrome P450 n=1 Tax=Ceratodon purpureus TaxID=3225 RepID=A0A8T0IFA6_CERPU|nr:hypothetical protein KC19_3G031100 [Ceratodon purpureus]